MKGMDLPSVLSAPGPGRRAQGGARPEPSARSQNTTAFAAMLNDVQGTNGSAQGPTPDAGSPVADDAQINTPSGAPAQQPGGGADGGLATAQDPSTVTNAAAIAVANAAPLPGAPYLAAVGQLPTDGRAGLPNALATDPGATSVPGDPATGSRGHAGAHPAEPVTAAPGPGSRVDHRPGDQMGGVPDGSAATAAVPVQQPAGTQNRSAGPSHASTAAPVTIAGAPAPGATGSAPETSPVQTGAPATAATAAPSAPPTAPAAAFADGGRSGARTEATPAATPAAAPAAAPTAASADALAAAGSAAAGLPAGQPTSSAAAAPKPAAPAAPQPGATLQPQLAKPLFTLAGAPQGQHIMTLQVTPEDLGPMTVRAQIDAGGVRIELFAPGDAGREAIRGILPELRKELADAGFGASVDVSEHSGPGSRARDGTSQDSSGRDGRDSGSGPGTRSGQGDQRPGHRWEALADGATLRNARILNGPQTTLDILV